MADQSPINGDQRPSEGTSGPGNGKGACGTLHKPTDYTACLRSSEWEVRPVPRAAAASLVVEHHSAHGGSNTKTFCHGLFRRGDVLHCLGVAWWIPPTRHAAASVWQDWRQVLSLSRLVVMPGVPKNAAGFLVRRSVRLIAAAGGWRCLVTWASTWQGHTGHVYRVTGWECLGLTSPEEVFVDPAGRLVARKAGGRTRTRAEMLALGFRSEGKWPKWKFRIILPAPRPRREHTLFDRLDSRQESLPDPSLKRKPAPDG